MGKAVAMLPRWERERNRLGADVVVVVVVGMGMMGEWRGEVDWDE